MLTRVLTPVRLKHVNNYNTFFSLSILKDWFFIKHKHRLYKICFHKIYFHSSLFLLSRDKSHWHVWRHKIISNLLRTNLHDVIMRFIRKLQISHSLKLYSRWSQYKGVEYMDKMRSLRFRIYKPSIRKDNAWPYQVIMFCFSFSHFSHLELSV